MCELWKVVEIYTLVTSLILEQKYFLLTQTWGEEGVSLPITMRVYFNWRTFLQSFLVWYKSGDH